MDFEHAIVAACVLARGMSPDILRERIQSSPRSWPAICRIAVAHQLVPQVAEVLPRTPETTAFHEEAMAWRGRNRWLAAELRAILTTLARSGVAVMPFKGPAFAAYAGLPLEMRSAWDIDLLVTPGHAAAAVEALRSENFHCRLPEAALRSRDLAQATFEIYLSRPTDELPLELHIATAPSWFAAPITLEEIFASGRITRYEDIAIRWPSPAQLLLLHMTDGLKAPQVGLRWLGDLCSIVETDRVLDWDVVARAGRVNGGTATVRVALEVLWRALECVRQLDLGVVPELPEPAVDLAREARSRPRLRRAVEIVWSRLHAEPRRISAQESLRWALRVSDRPMRTAASVLRYLAGPALADMQAMPSGASRARMRLRSLRRRLGPYPPGSAGGPGAAR